MKPVEVRWRLLRAIRRALDGPEFQSPAVSLARAIDQLRKFLLEQRAPKAKPVSYECTIRVPDEKEPGRPLHVRFVESKPAPLIYGWAIEYLDKRIKELLPLVSIGDLSKALAKVQKTHFGIESAEEVVLEAYCRIFDRNVKAINRKKLDANHAEPESGRAVYKEIEAMTKERRNCKLPWESTVDIALNRLGLPTGRGKAGPARGSRHKKTSKKRA